MLLSCFLCLSLYANKMHASLSWAQEPLQHAACSARGLSRRYLRPAHLKEVDVPGRLRSKALRGEAIGGSQLVHDMSLLLRRIG